MHKRHRSRHVFLLIIAFLGFALYRGWVQIPPQLDTYAQMLVSRMHNVYTGLTVPFEVVPQQSGETQGQAPVAGQSRATGNTGRQKAPAYQQGASQQTRRRADTGANQGKATPIISIVQGRQLENTYVYHFDNGLTARETQLFQQAIAAYNATGIVHLKQGQASGFTNTIAFGLYQKRMPANSGSFELGEGGPTIITRSDSKLAVNHAKAQFNADYASLLTKAVAVHELGHALGLDHSPNTNSVMYPVERGVSTLSPQDLQALSNIYSQN